MCKNILCNNFSLFKNSEYFEKKDVTIFTDSMHFKLLYPSAILLEELINQTQYISYINSFLNDYHQNINNFLYDEFPELRILQERKVYLSNRLEIIKLLGIVYKYNTLIKYINPTSIKKEKLLLLMSKNEIPLYENRFSNLYYFFRKDINMKIKILNFNDNLTIPYVYPSLKEKIIFKPIKNIVWKAMKNFLPLRKKTITLFKENELIQEMEPYLYIKGYSLKTLDFPQKFMQLNLKHYSLKKSKKMLSFLKEKLFLENKAARNLFFYYICSVYNKLYFNRDKFQQKELYSDISSLVISNSLTLNNVFFWYFFKIFKKGKIINISHTIGTGNAKKCNDMLLDNFRVELIGDEIFVQNRNVQKCLHFYYNKIPIYITGTPLEMKKRYFNLFKTNKIIFLSGLLFNNPHENNVLEINLLKEENQIIDVLLNSNKIAHYKPYPSKFLIDDLPNFRNDILFIREKDFRYMRGDYDIFLFNNLVGSSAPYWLIGANKPTIYLYNPLKEVLDDFILEIFQKSIFVINMDDSKWEERLLNLLNKPINDIIRLWKEKEKYRIQYDDYLIGRKYNAGKVGAEYIDKIFKEIKNGNNIK